MIEAAAEERAIAERLVEARLAGRALPNLPGPLPRDLAAAYRIQRVAVAAMGLAIVGWKAALVASEHRAALGVDRIYGPVLAGTVVTDADAPLAVPVIAGGSAAFEAELVVRLARDVPPGLVITPDMLCSYIGSVHAGAEFAGNPVPDIGGLGPLATIAAFANNAGLYLGPALAVPDACCFRLEIDGGSVGDGLGGDWRTALSATLTHAAGGRWPPRCGDLISTGALVIGRDIVEGQTITLHIMSREGDRSPRSFTVQSISRFI